MELVLATQQLAQPGGVQSYLLTIAPHLERLGYNVTLHGVELGVSAELARERGLRVTQWEHELPDDCGAVLAQDGVSALTMADRYPNAVHIIVVHGAEYDFHLPPGLSGLVSCAVVMNETVARRVQALASAPKVVRLRQPIDTGRLHPVVLIHERPRRVLILGNRLGSRRIEAIARACADAGVQSREVGIYGGELAEPLTAIAEADIVVGQGRSLLEGMACARAAWLEGPSAVSGWVTPDSYERFEQDGFRSLAIHAPIDSDTFTQALETYHASMGAVNRGLVLRHHSAYEHAVGLAALLTDARPAGGVSGAPLREMARLVRIQFDAQAKLDGVNRDMRVMHEAYRNLEDERNALQTRVTELQERVRELDQRLAMITGTRRWQAAGLAARPLDSLRRRLKARERTG